MSGGLPVGALQPHATAGDQGVQHVQAGLWWPAADPGKLRAAAAAWRSVAADLEAVSASASAVARSVTAENQGQAVDAFEAYWVGRWTGGSGALRAVADGAQALAAALDRYAAAVEKARARIQELIAAAVTVAIIGVGLTVLTVGVSDVAAGAVAGTLVATAAAVGMELSAEVAAIIATALVITSMGALQGGLSDLAIQTERIACFHDQPSIDWNEIGQWAAFGALAGTAGAGASTGLRAAAQIGAPTVGRIGERLGVEELPAWTSTRLGRRIGSMAAGAAGGAGTAALTDEVTTGQIDAADVLTGAFAGAGGGWVAGQPVYKRLTWVQQCDMLMAASRGKGQFGVGSATAADADILGHAWVGEGYTIASDGTTIVSADGLRQYRPPAYKPRQGRYQANLEWKLHGLRAWQSNAHIEIIDLP